MCRAFTLLIFLTVGSQAAYGKDFPAHPFPQEVDTAGINRLTRESRINLNKDARYADSIARVAITLSEQANYLRGVVMNYNNLSGVWLFRGEIGRGDSISRIAVALAEEAGDSELMADSYDFRSNVHFATGQYDSVRVFSEKTLEIAELTGNKKLLARSFGTIAMTYGIAGDHALSVEYFLKALPIYRELEASESVCQVLLNIGHTLEMAGNNTKALEYLRESLEMSRTAGFHYFEGWSLLNIGVVFDRLSQPDSAIAYFQKSLAIADSNELFRLRLTSLDNLGGQYSMKGDFVRANAMLNTAYDLATAAGNTNRLVYITGNLAENHLMLGEYQEALNFAEKQLTLALQSDLVSEQLVAYATLAQAYDSLRDYKEATNALRKYIVLRDSVFTNEKSEQIESLRETFEADNREEHIAMLEAQQAAELFRRNALAGIAILILVIGIMLYLLQRSRFRKKQALLVKEKEFDQLKAQFYDNITHEFRTPLTLILGPLDQMETELEDSLLQKKVRVMKRNATRLLALVNQILDMSRLQADPEMLQLKQQDILPLVKGVVMTFESQAEIRSISLEVCSPESDLTLSFDREKMEKILVNVVGNAMKFTPPGGRISVELSTRREELEILVRDTGSGIPEDDRENVFKRFRQSQGSEAHDGSGIGLAYVRELVQLHGGRVSAEPNSPQGTVIRILMPMEVQAAWVDDAVDSAVAGENADKPRLLLVEDNPDVMNYITEILSSEYTLLHACNGKEGEKLASEEVPDLVISDVMMPEMDGYEFCERLKSSMVTSHIPFILLTARDQTDDRIRGFENRADEFITKPFVPKELQIRIQNLLRSRQELREKFEREMIESDGISAATKESPFIRQLTDALEMEYGNELFGVEQLAEVMNMSRSQLHRKLVAVSNQTPTFYIRNFRLSKAREMIAADEGTIAEIAYRSGFNSPSYFTKCFRETFGYTPAEKQLKNS